MRNYPNAYGSAEDITPSDATIVNYVGIHVGGAGTLAVVTPTGGTPTFTVTAGEIIPLEVKQVLATGTSATALVGFMRG